MQDRIEYQHVSEMPGLVLGDGCYSDFHFDPHYHLDYHIGLVTDGVQRQRFQGQSVLLGHGRISVMPPGEIHDGHGEDNDSYRMKTFRLAPQLLCNDMTDVAGRLFTPELAGNMLEDPGLANGLLQLHYNLLKGEDVSLGTESTWLELLALMVRKLQPVKFTEIKGGLSQRHWQWVQEYCDVHLSEKIKLEQLSALCGLSRFQFLRRFERTTGLTPHAWLIRFRLERACLLLSVPGVSIAGVSQAVGFYDQSHFNRAFRQAYGVAPSAYLNHAA
ncbi:AraC family transcriptional regulator [Aliamphritea spongicola]|uniref:AraC family transcriptional regulator n=1 Tax=Aliamphritea spongicola TaxID=707589 RepID=UPI00196A6C34|nr:AraC family transcriptional regulator [Aliamphritea spongicola]MBN3562495.1 AraC family transcriptional regulator [Aliamphritea spongicola]